MKIHKKPKLFEFDETEGIVDIFVKKDPSCPYPFHEDDWWHQGFRFTNFLIYLQDFFKRHNLPYKVVEDAT